MSSKGFVDRFFRRDGEDCWTTDLSNEQMLVAISAQSVHSENKIVARRLAESLDLIESQQAEIADLQDQLVACTMPVSTGKIIEVITDLMESHDQLMAGIGNIVVDYKLLNECRINGSQLIAALEEG